MIFEYNQQLLPQNLLDIDDLGQLCLEGSNDDGMYFYLIIRTSLGSSIIATCGPVVPDIDMLPKNCCEMFKRIDYSEDKIIKEIENFLNGKNKLTDAKIISFDEAIECFRSIKDYVKNGGH